MFANAFSTVTVMVSESSIWSVRLSTDKSLANAVPTSASVKRKTGMLNVEC